MNFQLVFRSTRARKQPACCSDFTKLKLSWKWQCIRFYIFSLMIFMCLHAAHSLSFKAKLFKLDILQLGSFRVFFSLVFHLSSLTFSSC